jgi:hypothetical protein
MFSVNFWYYYMLCFHGCVSCNKKVVNFKLLAVLLYSLSTTVGKIHAQTFLIHTYITSHSLWMVANAFPFYSFLETMGRDGMISRILNWRVASISEFHLLFNVVLTHLFGSKYSKTWLIRNSMIFQISVGTYVARKKISHGFTWLFRKLW